MDADSARSEVTSSMQYIYQSWVLSLQNEALSEMLRGIAIVEMRHLDILGRLIAQLGGNPGYAVLQQGRPVSWSGSMVSYAQQPDRMLEGNILLEQHAVDTYTQQIAHIKDPYVVDVLKRILLDEQLHLEMFPQQFTTAARPECRVKRLVTTEQFRGRKKNFCNFSLFVSRKYFYNTK